MPTDKSHLLYTKNPEGVESFKYSQRGGNNDKPEVKKQVDRSVDFARILRFYERDFEVRANERNAAVNVPANITCVNIEFFSWFNSHDFEIRYRADFGLIPLKYYDLNTRVLFAVVDETLFADFLAQLKTYIATTGHTKPIYNQSILYIKDVKFHGTDKILQSDNIDGRMVYLSLLNSIELDRFTDSFVNAISQYLRAHQATYIYDDETHEFELSSVTQAELKEIAQNFDFVHSINAQRYMITRPGRFQTNIKEYPFNINSDGDGLPLIGVVDTGVSTSTPLGKLVKNTDTRYALNGMDPRVDTADSGYGHGTSVAALIALGPQLAGDIKQTLYAHANILSIKVLNDFSGVIGNAELAKLIKNAHDEHGIKIFNLSICYEQPLATGASFSDYAYLLDKLAYENDLLILVCTANSRVDDDVARRYPNHFADDETNFCAPADTMNNLVVGAVGDNLEQELAIMPEKYPLSHQHHPAPYTRKYHLDYERLTVKNSRLIKPDLVYAGGNYTMVRHPFLGSVADSTYEAALQVMSASQLEPVYRVVGTSFSTPLVANIAANIVRQYPSLKAQTVKALMINSAGEIKLDRSFDSLKSHHKRFLTGHGRPGFDGAVFSSDDDVTIIFEESILEGTVQSLPVKFPEYLLQLPGQDTVLEIDATLCFSFLPLQDNHLAYCPVNIAFAICKNIALLDDDEVEIETADKKKRKKKISRGISGGSKSSVAVFDNLWSQDAFFRSKMLSNTHKLSYRVRKSQLLDERNTFKVAVQCHYHKLLPDYILESLPDQYTFSLVLKVREVGVSQQLSGKLYNQMQLLNQLSVANEVQASLESDAVAEADS